MQELEDYAGSTLGLEVPWRKRQPDSKYSYQDNLMDKETWRSYNPRGCKEVLWKLKWLSTHNLWWNADDEMLEVGNQDSDAYYHFYCHFIENSRKCKKQTNAQDHFERNKTFIIQKWYFMILSISIHEYICESKAT